MQLRQIITERKNIQLASKGIAPQNSMEFIPKLKQYYAKLSGKWF